MIRLIDSLTKNRSLSDEAFAELLSGHSPGTLAYAMNKGQEACLERFGTAVFVRGLLEISNHCTNNCFYCGIRHSNVGASRYRLSPETIMDCAARGHALGFRTFVLQGGEDPFFTPDAIAAIVSALKKKHPDCAVTLSLGEYPREVYRLWKQAGADRYLLRHETANATHYTHLHPAGMSFDNRMKCIRDLKELGYQAGTGFMVGSPGQTVATLVEDLRFLRTLQPEMVGIGPFIPHNDTPFAHEPPGSMGLTLLLLAIIRLMLPDALIPATTSLATIHPQGREQGLLAGANVLMPNISPPSTRSKYSLYNNKAHTGLEDAGAIAALRATLHGIGRDIATGRGDFVRKQVAQG